MLRNARAVLDLFTLERAELGVVEAAELLHRHKSTVSRWMAAMEAAGFLERDRETGRYRVSMRLADGELSITVPMVRLPEKQGATAALRFLRARRRRPCLPARRGHARARSR